MGNISVSLCYRALWWWCCVEVRGGRVACWGPGGSVRVRYTPEADVERGPMGRAVAVLLAFDEIGSSRLPQVGFFAGVAERVVHLEAAPGGRLGVIPDGNLWTRTHPSVSGAARGPEQADQDGADGASSRRGTQVHLTL